jgi:Zn-dependent M28 family amino/carboxypeptidase
LRRDHSTSPTGRKFRRSTPYEQETLDGTDACFRHGIRASWREQRFGNTGPAALGPAAFNNRSAAVIPAALNDRAAAISAAAVDNRAADDAKHFTKYHAKHNDHDNQRSRRPADDSPWLLEAVRRQLDTRF